ncbi:hypothetical protein [Saccharopolyspora spinosa]|uniref:hypothetical protein n=1 Tax=Saccharopolyspora spinosa TaxID=60894 RepID=UPI000237B38D|nr:hypothetical protein [Saccharopolyspora spinosa]
MFALLQATAISDLGARRSSVGSTGCSPHRSKWPSPLSPWGGAALAELFGGYSAVFAVLATLDAFAALISLASMPARTL